MRWSTPISPRSAMANCASIDLLNGGRFHNEAVRQRDAVRDAASLSHCLVVKLNAPSRGREDSLMATIGFIGLGIIIARRPPNLAKSERLVPRADVGPPWTAGLTGKD